MWAAASRWTATRCMPAPAAPRCWRWRRRPARSAGASRSSTPVRAAPTIADGRMFVLTLDNQLQALAVDDGHRLWSYQARGAGNRRARPARAGLCRRAGGGRVRLGRPGGAARRHRVGGLERQPGRGARAQQPGRPVGGARPAGGGRRAGLRRQPGRADRLARPAHRPAPVGARNRHRRHALGGRRLAVRARHQRARGGDCRGPTAGRLGDRNCRSSRTRRRRRTRSTGSARCWPATG